MTPFEAYKLYIAIKNHFNSKSYDFFKYQGKNKLTYSSFEKRKDKIFFSKIAKHTDLQNFLLASFIKDSKIWVRQLAYSEIAEQNYQQWIKAQQALTYIFKQDISKLDDLNKCLKIEDNSHPELLRLFLQNQITLETLCIILELSGAKKYWDNTLDYDPVWDNLKLKVEKYIPFIKYDKVKFKQICLDHFS